MSDQYVSPRPTWLDAYLDYPHGGLSEEQAREITRYTLTLEEKRATRAGSALWRILREIRRKANYENAGFSDFEIPGVVKIRFPDTKVSIKQLTAAVVETTRIHRDSWINPLIDGLLAWTEGKADIRQIEKDLL